MKNFKHTEKLKKLYREYSYAHLLHSTINILLYLFYHVSIHLPSLCLSINPYNFWMHLKVNGDISTRHPKYMNIINYLSIQADKIYRKVIDYWIGR